MPGRRGDGTDISVEAYVSFRIFDGIASNRCLMLVPLVLCVFANILDHFGYCVVNANRGVN